VNTYKVWLRYELFRGRLTENGLRASEANLCDYIRSHSGTKPHLVYLQVEEQQALWDSMSRSGFNPKVTAKIFVLGLQMARTDVHSAFSAQCPSELARLHGAITVWHLLSSEPDS
jgi:hypothetical protein